VSTLAARKLGVSLLLNKGLIRISLPVPATADFQITDIQAHTAARRRLRRNLRCIAVRCPLRHSLLDDGMWDGRESPKGRSLEANLLQQAIDATSGMRRVL